MVVLALQTIVSRTVNITEAPAVVERFEHDRPETEDHVVDGADHEVRRKARR